MHEGSLTEDLFEHVLIHAREAHARRVTHVKVTIGALSDMTAESIQFYWESMAPGTIAAQAALEFDSAPGTARCPTCGEAFEILEAYAACPKCGAFPVQGHRQGDFFPGQEVLDGFDRFALVDGVNSDAFALIAGRHAGEPRRAVAGLPRRTADAGGPSRQDGADVFAAGQGASAQARGGGAEPGPGELRL